MADTKQILARLLEGARLNEEEDLGAEESKTENPENATIPDENTEVKPVDAKEDDFIENKNDVDVELTESDDCDKEDCKDDDCDKKGKEDDKGEKKESEDDKEDESNDESKDDDEKLNEEVLQELFEKLKAKRAERKAASAKNRQTTHETQRDEAVRQRDSQDNVRKSKNAEAEAESKKAQPDHAKAAAAHEAAADASMKAFGHAKNAAINASLAHGEKLKGATQTAKAEAAKNALARKEAAKTTKAKVKALKEEEILEKLYNMFLEELELDAEESKTENPENATIPDENTEVKPVDAKEDDFIENKNDEDVELTEGTKSDEELKSLASKAKTSGTDKDANKFLKEFNKKYPIIGKKGSKVVNGEVVEESEVLKNLFAMFLEELELDAEESKTDVADNDEIPDENTEVVSVDVKTDDVIENDNDEDVELTEEALNEIFDRLRLKYHTARAAKNTAKSQTASSQAAVAHKRADTHTQAKRSALDTQEKGAASGDTKKEAAGKLGAEYNGRMAAQHTKNANRLDNTAGKTADKAKIHGAKRDELDHKVKMKDASKDAKKAVKNAKKKGAFIYESEEFQELFKMFLEDMGYDMNEDLLDGNNPEVLAAAEAEDKDPEEVLNQAEAETALDAETAVYELNDKEITESINNIFKYLREEGLDLGTEESKTENPENATIPDENTEVKPVDAKEDDFIENKNDEDVELTEAKKFKSLREAYAVDPGYYSRDSKQLVTSKDKINSLTESLAFIEAKNANDYLFEELLRAANKVEMLRESIFEKYGEEAAAKAMKIAKLTNN